MATEALKTMKPATRWVRNCVLAAAAVLALGSGARAADDQLRVGDRLKITFFETMEMQDQAAGGAGSNKLQMIYQRMDLSGEYPVEIGGTISLPILGAIKAEGSTLGSLRDRLLASFSSTMGRTASVTASIIQRTPVYIAGSVRNPGAFPHVPGMIALQAVALAGGIDRDQIQASRVIDLIRQREQGEVALSRIGRLLARQAVLNAARKGVARADIPPRLVEVAGVQGAAQLVDAEQRLFDLQRKLRSKTREAQGAMTEKLRGEITILQTRLGDFDAQLKVRQDRLRRMEGLFARQIIEDERVNEVRKDYVDTEGRRRDLEVTLVQAGQRLAQSESQTEITGIGDDAAMEAELKQLDADIAQASETIFAYRAISAVTLEALPESGPVLEILRSGSEGSTILPATETSRLEPGDVLRVSLPSQNAPMRRSGL